MAKELSQEEMQEIFNLGLQMMPESSKPKKYLSLIYGDEPSIVEESFRIVLDSGIFLSNELFKIKKGKNRTELEQNAMIVFQMVLTKGITLLDLYDGLNYENSLDKKIKLEAYNDPFSMSLLVRNQLESFSNFNNIFLSSEDKNVVELLHNFWILCGLKRRQGFIHDGMDKEHFEKGRKEKETIDQLNSEIESNPVYKSLSDTNRRHVDKVLRRNSFQLKFDGAEFKKTSWGDLFNAASNTSMLKNIYSEMSLKSHPSYVSVFQFAQSATIDKEHSQSSFYLHMSRIIMAFMIFDCVSLFPEAKEVFSELPDLNRALISTLNRNLREPKWLVLEDDLDYNSEIRMEVFDFIDNEINKLED